MAPSRYGDEFEVGQVFTTQGLTVTESHVVSWAGLTGDFYPLHVDAEKPFWWDLPVWLASGKLDAIMDDFEEVLASGTNPQKKHLLRRLVKKVLISDRHTVEVWYGLPNRTSVRMPGSLAPREGFEPPTR